MKILALESSGLVASVALWADGCLMGEYTTNFKKTHSQTLLPMLDGLMTMLGVSPDSCDALAVSAGPGSFTGLRIGSATAKGIGLALNLPIIEVPTVDAIAYNLFGTDRIICPLMDARRQQVYTGLYTFTGADLTVVTPQKVTAIDAILEELGALGRPVIFTGDGVPVYKDVIQTKCTVDYVFAPAHLAAQRAGALASLAAVYYNDPAKKDHVVNARDHQPDYLRLSQAERELAAKNAAKKNEGGDEQKAAGQIKAATEAAVQKKVTEAANVHEAAAEGNLKNGCAR